MIDISATATPANANSFEPKLFQGCIELQSPEYPSY